MDFSSDTGDEIGVTVGRAGKSGAFAFDLGLSYLNLNEVSSLRAPDVLQPFLGVSYPVAIEKGLRVAPYVRLETPIPLGGAGKGVYAFVGIQTEFESRVLPLTISQKMTVLYDSGALGAGSGLVGQYHLGAIWRLTKKITLEAPLLRASFPLTRMTDERSRSTGVVYGVGLIVPF
jgi:hypothetical protein